jgi:hypothetical protein
VKPGPLEHVDPLEELIRVVNEAQDRETNIVFMIPSSANCHSFSNEAGLNNHMTDPRRRQYINTYVD